MESFSMVRRRTSDLLQNVQQNVQQNLPTMGGPRKTGLNGTWEHIAIQPITRSHHSLDVISGTAYIFGGQDGNDQPLDNDMHVVTLPFSTASADYRRIKAAAPTAQDLAIYTEGSQSSSDDDKVFEAEDAQDLDEVPLASPPTTTKKDKGKQPATEGPVPQPRYAHATAVIGTRVFLFGGLGADAKPLEEAGRVWIFDVRTNKWSYLDPAPAIKGGSIVRHPESRGYHCATAIDRPRDFAPPPPKKPQNWQEWAIGDVSKSGTPQDPIVGNVAEEAIDQESEGYGTFIVNGGVLGSGERTSDVWAFDVRTKTWTEFPAAPGPGRSGSSICVSKSRLFRFGGFDGQAELGGQIDFLHLQVEMFDDRVTRGEISISARNGWQSLLENNADASSSEVPLVAGQPWPSPRSGALLQPLSLGGGAEYLILAMGQREAAVENVAAKAHDDVWAFEVPPQGMSTASFAAAFMQAIGRKTGEGKWTKLTMGPYDDENDHGEPRPRSWLASAPMGDLDETGIVVWGGIATEGRQLGDGWILRLGDTRTSY